MLCLVSVGSAVQTAAVDTRSSYHNACYGVRAYCSSHITYQQDCVQSSATEMLMALTAALFAGAVI